MGFTVDFWHAWHMLAPHEWARWRVVGISIALVDVCHAQGILLRVEHARDVESMVMFGQLLLDLAQHEKCRISIWH
jgi:hypothetical protein